MSSFFEELKRRNVIKASIAYLVVAWVILQVLSIVLPNAGAPEWVMKTLMILMIVGFPVWVFIAWVYEVTPDGLKKTKEVSKENSISSTTNRRLNILILVALIGVILVTFLKPTTIISNSFSDDGIKQSIAVLPFDNMSSDKDNEWFCDGMTEDILTQLAKINGLRVISRTSTEKFKNTEKTVPEIAKELRVSYVLEGSVRKQGNAVLITAQLINANDEHLWAENYNEQLNDVFKIQADVSNKIVDQLRISISPEEKSVLENTPTTNMEAYQALLKGRSFIDKGGRDNQKIAIDFLENAIDLDPNYGDAYAELAYTYIAGFEGEKEDVDKFREYSEKAISLDPNSARANSVKGIAMFTIDSLTQAKEYFDKALKLNPNDARIHQILGTYYFSEKAKNIEKSFHHINIAHEIDPFSREINYVKAAVLIESDSLDQAIKHIDENESFFSKILKFQLQSGIYNKKSRNLTKEKKDRMVAFDVYREGIEKYPRNAFMYRFLAKEYDGVLNDDENFVKYSEIAYRLDSITLWPAVAYYNALVESGELKKATALYDNETFNKLLNPTRKVQRKFYLHYYNQAFYKAQTLLNDTLISEDYWGKLLNAASLKNRSRVDTLLKKHKYSVDNNALLYAILQEPDSLYHYLDNEDIDPLFINARREIDPYRKETRYIEFLKKHYFPVDQQKN